jgi:hypothetical protein
MINKTKLTEAGQQCATAYDAHYTTKDMYKDFKLYGRIIAAHPDTHEGLISDLSAGFVNISSNEVDGEINKWLQRITEFFDADRCTLGLFSEDMTQLVSAFEYYRAGVEPAPASLSQDQLPWYLSQLMQGKFVVINRLEDLPADAAAERRLFLAKSMKSIL